MFRIHLEFVLKKTLLYKSFLLMSVQCQNCKRITYCTEYFFTPFNSGVARGVTRSRAQALEAQQHSFCSHFKRLFSKNLDQNMLKKIRIFWEKTIKIVSPSGATPPNPVCLRRLCPQTLALLLPSSITTLSSSFL